MNVPETAALLEPADPFATLCRLDRLCRAGPIRPSPEASWSEVESPEAAQVLVFETDGWLLALPQPWVTEVLRRPRLTRIPNAPDAIQGFMRVSFSDPFRRDQRPMKQPTAFTAEERSTQRFAEVRSCNFLCANSASSFPLW